MISGSHRVAVSAVVGGTASALGGGKFANGAISAAFAHLFSEMPAAANDENYGLIPEDEWGGIIASSDRIVGYYDDPYYFDPREISATGPTWQNFGEYVVDVGPYFVGGGAGIALKAVRPASGFLHGAHHNFGTRRLPAWMKHFQLQVDKLGAPGPIRIPYGKKFKYKYGDKHLDKGNAKLGEYR